MSLFADVMNARLEQLDKAATPVEKIWDDVKTWTSDAWAWIGDHTLGALSLILTWWPEPLNSELLLVQGIWRWLNLFSQPGKRQRCARRWCVVW